MVLDQEHPVEAERLCFDDEVDEGAVYGRVPVRSLRGPSRGSAEESEPHARAPSLAVSVI